MPVLLRLSEKVAHRLRKAEFAAKGVTLKLKTADFKTRTRARAMPPTQLALRIFEAGRELLLKEADGTRFRLIGIGASEIVAGDEADRGDLVDTSAAREVTRERAIDKLRDKFGREAVMRGLVFKARQERDRR